jgi:glycosyltransferase involved in cell wall biosynthesis
MGETCVRTVCILNNYNYGRYLHDCLDAVLGQTEPFDRVIVVDDGSTDESRQILQYFAERHASLTLVLKPNAGQLSCFNAAAVAIENDDLVVMCDTDDLLPSDYLQHLRGRHQKRLADFYFCDPAEFSDDGTTVRQTAVRQALQADFLMPCTSALTRRFQCWIGSPTSCISLTGRFYREILPYPHEADWRTRADDVLVYGAALLGARKLYIPSLQVGYRVHGANHFFGRTISAADEAMRRHSVEKLFGWYCAKQNLSPISSNAAAELEYQLIPLALRQRFALPSPKEFMSRRERRRNRWKRNLGRLVGLRLGID